MHGGVGNGKGRTGEECAPPRCEVGGGDLVMEMMVDGRGVTVFVENMKDTRNQ